VHQNQRFSEDLHFDNFDLNQHEFDEISQNVKNELERSGFTVEIKQIIRGAYHC
jgi:predicted nucleotidyltransferase component of viral defense system